MDFEMTNPPKFLLPFSVLFTFHFCQGQVNRPVYEIGLNLGQMVYQGDLTPSALGSFRTSRFSMGFSVAKYISTSFAIRGALVFGSIAGNDAAYSKPAYRQQRNFSFNSPVKEITGQAVWNLPGVPQHERGFSGYVFAGGGISLLNVKPNAGNFNAEYFGTQAAQIQNGLAADASHGTPSLLPLLLAGAGVKYFFKPQLGVQAEASYRITYTDYLDGFSRSANPSLNDHYMNYSVGILYRTGRKGSSTDCPKIVY